MAPGRGAPAGRDGPADARGDQVVHLRRPADGPRRPRARADPAARGARARPAGRRPGRVRLAGPGPAAADGPRERAVPDPRRGAGRLPRRASRTGCRSGSTGPTSSRRASSATARRAAEAPAADADARREPTAAGPAAGPRRDDRGPPRRRSATRPRRPRASAIVVLPPSTWREIQGRAASIGVAAELLGRRRRAALWSPSCPPIGRPARRPIGVMIGGRRGQGLVEYGLILGPDRRCSRPSDPRASSAGRWRTSSARSATRSTRRPAADRRSQAARRVRHRPGTIVLSVDSAGAVHIVAQPSTLGVSTHPGGSHNGARHISSSPRFVGTRKARVSRSTR